MDVETFDQLAGEFHARVSRIAWCVFATIAPGGSPWTRVLHPIWEGPRGWIATGRHTPKARHLAHDPRFSLTYWDAEHDVVHVRGHASWADDQPTRSRIWELFRATPPPLGYDPAPFWGTPDSSDFGLIRLEPSLIDVTGLASAAERRMVWRPSSGSGQAAT